VRLDHLLSKEHHEKHSNWWSVSREGFSSVVDEGRVHNNRQSPDTLLGPETTVGRKFRVVSLHLGGGVWCLSIA
jgi:hypothetical protein